MLLKWKDLWIVRRPKWRNLLNFFLQINEECKELVLDWIGKLSLKSNHCKPNKDETCIKACPQDILINIWAHISLIKFGGFNFSLPNFLKPSGYRSDKHVASLLNINILFSKQVARMLISWGFLFTQH